MQIRRRVRGCWRTRNGAARRKWSARGMSWATGPIPQARYASCASGGFPRSGGLHARILLRPIFPRLPSRGGRTGLSHEGWMPVPRERRGGRLSARAAVFKLRPLRSGERRGAVPRGRFRLQGLRRRYEGEVHSGSALGGRSDIFLRTP